MTTSLTEDFITSLSSDIYKHKLEDENIEEYSYGDSLSTNSYAIVTPINADRDAYKRNFEDNFKALEQFVYNKIIDGHISEVQKILNELENTATPLLTKWRKAFCIPTVKNAKISLLKEDEISKEIEWVKQNRKKYESMWVALQDFELLGYDKNLKQLKEIIKSLNKNEKVTFLKL